VWKNFELDKATGQAEAVTVTATEAEYSPYLTLFFSLPQTQTHTITEETKTLQNATISNHFRCSDTIFYIYTLRQELK